MFNQCFSYVQMSAPRGVGTKKRGAAVGAQSFRRHQPPARARGANANNAASSVALFDSWPIGNGIRIQCAGANPYPVRGGQREEGMIASGTCIRPCQILDPLPVSAAVGGSVVQHTMRQPQVWQPASSNARERRSHCATPGPHMHGQPHCLLRWMPLCMNATTTYLVFPFCS